MKIEITLTWFVILVIIFSVIQFIASVWIKSELEKSIAARYDRVLEDYKYNLKVRERAEKVAEYMALQTNLKESSPQNEYDTVNKLGWELAMWLPADVYRKVTQAATRPTLKERFETVIEVRKLLLGDKAGDLTWNDVMFHAPGIGKHNK
jgi:ABC-type uncharacterized transport system fused permease/ATPase subunit